MKKAKKKFNDIILQDDFQSLKYSKEFLFDSFDEYLRKNKNYMISVYNIINDTTIKPIKSDSSIFNFKFNLLIDKLSTSSSRANYNDFKIYLLAFVEDLLDIFTIVNDLDCKAVFRNNKKNVESDLIADTMVFVSGSGIKDIFKLINVISIYIKNGILNKSDYRKVDSNGNLDDYMDHPNNFRTTVSDRNKVVKQVSVVNVDTPKVSNNIVSFVPNESVNETGAVNIDYFETLVDMAPLFDKYYDVHQKTLVVPKNDYDTYNFINDRLGLCNIFGFGQKNYNSRVRPSLIYDEDITDKTSFRANNIYNIIYEYGFDDLSFEDKKSALLEIQRLLKTEKYCLLVSKEKKLLERLVDSIGLEIVDSININQQEANCYALKKTK